MTNENPRRAGNTAGAVDQTAYDEFTAPFASLQSQSKLAWALEYARRGLHVFPLHSIRNGQCTCGQNCGKNAGKHPRVTGGFKAATIDPKQITSWWTKWPDANIGIATGAISGIVVIDIDGPKGLEALRQLEAELGPLPPGPTAKTARGSHRFFGHTGEFTPCSAADGLDVRGDGGYVVAPPSDHLSGHVYQWCSDVP